MGSRQICKLNSSTSDTTKDFFEGANTLTTSVGKVGNSSSITVPSGVTKGILFISSGVWQSHPVPYKITGNGIVSKTTLSSNGGCPNNAVIRTDYEIDYVTLSPGNTITIEITVDSSYPSAYMTLYY